MDEDVNRPPQHETELREPSKTGRPAAPSRLTSLGPEVRIGAVVALALVAGLVVWLLVRDNGNSPSASGTSAQAASAQELAALPTTVRHPVYWAGPKRGFTYELTRTPGGRIYLRSLPAGVAVGSNQPKYLTIGTYPLKNALVAVRRIAKRLHVSAIGVNGGGAAVQDTKHPTSVYLAYPGSDYQIEVYDPSPAHGLQLVLSGGIIPLESSKGPTRATSGRPKAATVQQLRALESSSGGPVYWVGPKARTTYEVT